jgi:hypothetical protein
MNQQTESHHALMLDIAREAIQQRAAKDGYEPTGYDAERDPEGYITSLLNALHQWTHCHGIDWDKELTQAQGIFEQDVAESQGGGDSLPPPAIDELRCPKCGHSESFVIEVSECLLMFSDGVVMPSDTREEWDDWSPCRCHACYHPGTVYQFRASIQPEKEVKSHG